MNRIKPQFETLSPHLVGLRQRKYQINHHELRKREAQKPDQFLTRSDK